LELNEEIIDITIIGGGPAGLFASFYAGMREMSVKIIDSLPQLGGQLIELYPDKYIYDVGGFPKILAKDLVDNLVIQAHYANPEILLGETALNTERNGDHFVLTTDKGVHLTRTILITGGIGAFQPRKIGLTEESLFEGKTLHYGIKDLSIFKDKKVVVCGGGDSAVDWALMLENLSSEVTLIHRRDRFTAHETSVNELMQSKVDVKTSLSVKAIEGDNGKISEILVMHRNGDEERMAADHLIVNYGNISSLGPLKEWGLTLERNSITVNTRMETNIEGIYAAGDITTYDGKVKLIATGLGEAPIAVNNAKAYIDPKARVQPLHSTTVFS
jgi:thioredoxin reductase (NADPH)